MKYMLFLLLSITIQFCSAQSIDVDGRTFFEMESGDTTFLMYQYFFCSLESVENRASISDEETAKIQQAHLAHIKSMSESGAVSVAGPYGDEGTSRGILIMNCATIEEAEALAAKDPAVIANRLTINIRPIWLAKGSVLK